MSDKPIYASLDALEPVKRVLGEAGTALADPARRVDLAAISEMGAALGGGVAGAAVGVGAVGAMGAVVGLSGPGIMSGLAALGGLIGAGAAAGIAVAAAPAVLLAVGGYAAVSKINNNKLMEAKRALYQEAVSRQQAILQELKTRSDADRDRLEYLTALNHQLQAAIRNLRQDLGET